MNAVIHELIEGKAQADPKLKTTFAYTKVSANAVLNALITEKGYAEDDWERNIFAA
ncbi:MAG: hypothetical protein AAGF01_13680 [Cyanobacteria bacterium P01_G01_bin.38]